MKLVKFTRRISLKTIHIDDDKSIRLPKTLQIESKLEITFRNYDKQYFADSILICGESTHNSLWIRGDSLNERYTPCLTGVNTWTTYRLYPVKDSVKNYVSMLVLAYESSTLDDLVRAKLMMQYYVKVQYYVKERKPYQEDNEVLVTLEKRLLQLNAIIEYVEMSKNKAEPSWMVV